MKDVRAYIDEETAKLKELKKKYGKKMTPDTLRETEGFENLSDEIATEMIEQLEEYATIVLMQMNRLESEKIMNTSSGT